MVGSPIETMLVRRLGEGEIDRTISLVGAREPSPYAVGGKVWPRTREEWAERLRVCLGRSRGAVVITGVISVGIEGGLGRMEVVAAPLVPAGDLAPGVTAPLDLKEVQARWPKAEDVFVPRSQRAVLVRTGSRLAGFDAVSLDELFSLELEGRTVVMAEWAHGAEVARWREALGLPRR